MKYKLIHGDCMSHIIPKSRLLLTDIPYGNVNRNSGGLRSLDKDNADEETFEIQKFLQHTYDSFDICIIFCDSSQVSEIYNFFDAKQKRKRGTVRQLIWCKRNPSPMNGEYIYLSGIENAVWFKKAGTGKMNSKCKKNWFVHSNGSSKYVPTEKNHALLEELILDNTSEGDLVVDVCMGGGSSGIVALKNNRKFFGIEIDQATFEIAETRIKECVKP